MHAEALIHMETLLQRAPAWATKVLDAGSLDENGTLRPLAEARGWTYIGVDIREGKNVDIVVPPYEYPFEDGAFDVVMSGQAAEHVERVWVWIVELARVLKPGGLLAMTAPWKFFYHPFPVDCWRFMPDGFRVLFDETGVLTNYHIEMVSDYGTTGDLVASAIKR